jgi:hypothetical protein
MHGISYTQIDPESNSSLLSLLQYVQHLHSHLGTRISTTQVLHGYSADYAMMMKIILTIVTMLTKMVMSTSEMPETSSSISISLLDKPVPNLRPHRHQITIKSPSNPTHPPNTRLPDRITMYHLLTLQSTTFSHYKAPPSHITSTTSSPYKVPPSQSNTAQSQTQKNKSHSRRRKFTTATQFLR